ncbi:GNAT family N-acetyltransferase [Microbacterium sp. ZW T5_56]|uniref:GNAT family N-acetyltransferase n=1 Tax=Microbacterium sp. ZW T5_56 TaxID=3378081 RepID=UPI003854BD8A
MSDDTPDPTDERTEIAWPLRTERLLIRPATVEDAASIWEYRSLPDVYAWITAAPQSFVEFEYHFSAPERLALTLVIELAGDEPQVIGDLMLRRSDAYAQAEIRDQARDAEVELGWVLNPAHTRRGYATEAIRAVRNAAFDQLGAHRVIAACFAANEPSWRLMERVGMRREEYSRASSLHRSGAWMDSMTYAILDTDPR